MAQSPVNITTNGVSISQDTLPPNEAAMFDVRSVNKGVLLPRWQGHTITSPADAMLILDELDSSFLYYEASSNCWRKWMSFKTCTESMGYVPVGGVIAFYSTETPSALWDNTGLGLPDTKMEGWALCNGSTYATPTPANVTTPDLQGRFIAGTGKYQNTDAAEKLSATYQLGEKGGFAKYNLAGDEVGAYAHTHAVLPAKAKITLTGIASGNTDQAPDHHHTFEVRKNGTKVGDTDIIEYDRGAVSKDSPGNTSSGGGHTHDFNVNGVSVTVNPASFRAMAGENAKANATDAHENRPPYYTLYYIMRIY